MDDAVRNIGAFGAGTLAAFQQLNVHSYAGSQRSASDWVLKEGDNALWVTGKAPKGKGWSLILLLVFPRIPPAGSTTDGFAS